jgi:hypothetical protein
LKDSLKKMLAHLRKGAGASWVLRRTFGESDRPPAQSTGETVFGDRSLRTRKPTRPELGEPVSMDAAVVTAGFKIRVAKLQRGKRAAVTLVANRYGTRGYSIPPLKQDPNLFTFIAYDEGVPVGTVALRLDSDKALSADKLYKKELNQLRKAGSRLCEFTRLAVDSTAASKAVLAGLFHTAYLYGNVIHGCTHAVIEVTPQHAGFYNRALRFEQIGAERLNPRVNTQGVLMCVAFEAIAEGLAKYAGKPDVPGATRSLFVYGFAPSEEAGVLNRLRELIKERDAQA